MIRRRSILLAAPAFGSAAALGSFSTHARQGFPDKPIKVICGSTPGALLDYATRLYCEKMAPELKQPIVVENLAGASSLLAVRAVMRAPPDGYTLLTVANTLVSMPHVSKNANYQLSNFTPLGEMARSPSVMVVSAASPFQSVADVVAAAKRNPGRVTYASGGLGAVSHLAAALFAKEAGIALEHVPYKGVAPAVTDLVSDRVGFMMATPTSVEQMARSGRLRILAITSAQRSPVFTEIPTFAELGWPKASFEIWVGIFAPANLPRDVISRLAQVIEVVRNDADVVKKLAGHGQHVGDVKTQADFEKSIYREDETFSQLFKDNKSLLE